MTSILNRSWRNVLGGAIGLGVAYLCCISEVALHNSARANYYDDLPFPFAETNIRVISRSPTSTVHRALGALFTGSLERVLILGEPALWTPLVQSWNVFAGISNYVATSIYVVVAPYWYTNASPKSYEDEDGWYTFETDTFWAPTGEYVHRFVPGTGWPLAFTDSIYRLHVDYHEILNPWFYDQIFIGSNFAPGAMVISNWVTGAGAAWQGFSSGVVMTGMVAELDVFTSSVTISKQQLTTNLIPGQEFLYKYDDPNGGGTVTATGHVYLTQAFIAYLDELLYEAADSQRYVDFSQTNASGNFETWLQTAWIDGGVTNYPNSLPVLTASRIFSQLDIGFSTNFYTSHYGQVSATNYAFTRVPERTNREWVVGAWSFYSSTNGTGWVSRYGTDEQMMHSGLRRPLDGALVQLIPEDGEGLNSGSVYSVSVTGIVLDASTFETNDQTASYTLSSTNWMATTDLWVKVTGVGGSASPGTTGDLFRIAYTGSTLVAGTARWFLSPEDMDERATFARALVAVIPSNDGVYFVSSTDWVTPNGTSYVYGTAQEGYSDAGTGHVADGDSWSELWAEADAGATVYGSGGQEWPYARTLQDTFDVVVSATQTLHNLKRVRFVNGPASLHYQSVIGTGSAIVANMPDLSNFMPQVCSYESYQRDTHPKWRNNTFPYTNYPSRGTFDANGLKIATNDWSVVDHASQFYTQIVDLAFDTGGGNLTNTILPHPIQIWDILKHGNADTNTAPDMTRGFGDDPIIDGDGFGNSVDLLPYYRFNVTNGFKFY